ncbi:sigma 54-interacting transcriptional regulator [Clostridiaceae bacterium 35-E11]
MLSEELNDIMEEIFREGSILSFLNSLNKGIIIIDNRKIIVYTNKIAQKNLKKSFSSLQGKKIEKLIPFRRIEDVLTDGLSFYSVTVPLEEEISYVNISPIEINKNIIGALIAFEPPDCIENSLDTIKLCNSISRELEAVFNSAYDEMIVTDNRGTILRINALYEKLYNLKSEDFIGKNVSELEKKGAFNPSVILKVIKEKKRISLTQETNSGKILIVTGTPVFDEKGSLISIVSMAKDITELHKLKAKLKEVKETAQKYYYQLELLKQKEESQAPMIYKSTAMKKIITVAEKVSKVNSNVLITGESGVGKSILAEYIHKMSDRKEEKFININCGAIPETLLESEFFGYEKGAFTGARTDGKVGQLDLADKGTLFLDEISELPLHMQVKLLKVINEKKYMRVGGTKLLKSDFRLIAATNKNLGRMVKEGRFREDLFYRLNVIPIDIPPLRERKQDTIMLISHFWEKLNKKFGTNRKISGEVYDILTDYHWPGNVRELQNCIERIMVTVDTDMVKVKDLPVFFIEQSIQEAEKKGILPLKEAIEETERRLILKAYKKLKNTYKVAEILGVSQATIVRKLKKYGNEKNIH